MMETIDRITPEGKRFYAELKKLEELEVRVGYQAGGAKEGGGEGDDVDICSIAIWMELGTYNSPARPFLRKSVDENEDKIHLFCTETANTLASGGTAEDVLKKIGVYAKGLVQDKITSGAFEPNAPGTIEGGWMHNKKSGKLFYAEGKHSAKPLVNTGRLLQSVNFQIRRKGDTT